MPKFDIVGLIFFLVLGFAIEGKYDLKLKKYLRNL